MSERDRLYCQILHFGLLSLREAARISLLDSTQFQYAQYCALEADHLHNIPSLIGDTNESRHDYYFDMERTLYLEGLDRSVWDSNFTLNRYTELWQQLADLRKPA